MKIISKTPKVFVIILILFVSACSMSSSQFESFTSNDNQPKLRNFYWDVNYDNLNYRLIAIGMPNGTLFADKFGNSLFFDGWSISSIVGFGDFEGEFDLQETDVGSFNFITDNSYNLENSCDEWKKTPLDNSLIYTQACGIEKIFTNSININSAGEITQIKQFLEPFNKLMTLTKQN